MELGKLTWVPRMARPDLMYDIFGAAQIFPKGEINVEKPDKKTMKEAGEKEAGKKDDFSHMPGFLNFQKEDSKGVNNVKFSKMKVARRNRKYATRYKI